MTGEITVLSGFEYSSIAAGIKMLDIIVKAAPVTVFDVLTVTPGKYVILFTGDVASVDVSYNAGLDVGKEFLLDNFLITNLHPMIIPAFNALQNSEEMDALGIVETLSVVSAIEAADIAVKETDVKILEIRYGSGMGGKSSIKLTGNLADIEEAMTVCVDFVKSKEQLCYEVIIPRPHEDIKPFFI